MATLSKATEELQSALESAISYQPNSSALPNNYERRRALRRVDRAVTSLEEALPDSLTGTENDESNIHELNCVHKGDDTGNNNDVISVDGDDRTRKEFKTGGILEKPVFELLMDVITELPKVIFGLDNMATSNGSSGAITTSRNPINRSSTSSRVFFHSSSNSSVPPSDSNKMNGSTNTLLLQDLYDQTANTACRIFFNHGSLPLDPCHIDRLLDQIASAVIASSSFSSRAKIHYGIVAIINSSLDSAVNEVHNQQQQDSTNQPALFLLNAIETLKLTQILIPLSLKHLSYPWVFHPTPDGSACSGNDVFSNEEQESKVQLRLLIGNLFRHLSTLLSSDQLGDENNNISNSSNGNSAVSFENILYRVFQEDYRNNDCSNNSSASSLTSVQEGRDMDCKGGISLQQQHYMHSISHQEMVLAIEDYMDLASSFLIENVEYAVNTIDASSHHLQNIGMIASQQNENPHGLSKSPTTKCLDYPSSDGYIQYLKGVIMHTSIAIGMVETFRDGLGLYLPETNSSNDKTNSSINSSDSSAHLGNLWNAFANFVSMLSENEMILDDSWMGKFHQPRGKEDIQLFSNLVDSVDNDLFRLYILMSGTSKGDSSAGNIESNAVVKGGCSQMMTLLRAYHWIGSQYQHPLLDSENSEIVFADIIKNISAGLKSMVTKNGSKIVDSNILTKDDQVRVSRKRSRWPSKHEEAAISEETTMLQACLLSTLLLPDTPSACDNNGSDINKEGRILAALADPLLYKDTDTGLSASKKVKGSHTPFLTDPLNPWHSLLSTKISEALPWFENCANANPIDIDTATAQLPRNVAASSTSIISDLSLAQMGSTNVTETTSRSSASIGRSMCPQHTIDSDHNGREILTLKTYLQAVDPHVRT